MFLRELDKSRLPHTGVPAVRYTHVNTVPLVSCHLSQAPSPRGSALAHRSSIDTGTRCVSMAGFQGRSWGAREHRSQPQPSAAQPPSPRSAWSS